ncbi:Flp pilus assembly protein CpaB [Desulfococcus multivorans]|uniref:Flp pilus assembly protein CpaB n=1 Tax=Desulfococcus multivorans DSM 2059 TaxID=1121405 RepID=S7TCI2_DESML|nr:Flp pilus assembly protein CpaB [Desulfococcus multivorans]AOY58737.1 CpaB: Flp pilus assembly protein [Desulfococcus multivorans]AQV01021.1 Flp pilus assembly protein CpaB [Desulfococcus multivorans]EPR34351.1 Flp pilus assembly protein CpaB [Desulfococcus multivorans DSM 2059]SJZ49080.1 pilus assembly protein CpaB [Desulfococcus multivorans DSM 2059]
MGRTKALIPMILAVLIAAVGSFFVYNWLRGQKAPMPEIVESRKQETQTVAVAAANIPWGTKLTKEMVKAVPFLKSSIPAGAFIEPDKLVDRVVLVPVRENIPILESMLASADVKTGGMAVVVSPGKRAVAVRGDKVLGLSGLVHPGNRVDVLVSIADDNGEEITKLVLEKIPVLAAGPQMQLNEKGEPMPVDVYTLEVTPEESEKLALAATRGQLHFALRNIQDKDGILTQGATVEKTLASLRGAPPPVAPEPTPTAVKAPRPASRRIIRREPRVTVEVYNGDTKLERRLKY